MFPLVRNISTKSQGQTRCATIHGRSSSCTMTHLIRPRSASAVPPIPVAFHRLPYIMWFTAPSTLLNSVGRRALNILKASVLRGEEKRKREKNPPDTRLQSVIPVAYFPRFTERRHFNKTLNNAKTEFNRSNI